MSIVAYPLNNTDYTAEDAMLYNCSKTSGVLDEGDNLDISITDNRKITISAGIAWIRYKKLAGIAVGVKNAESLMIDVSDAILNRIDTVVLGYSAAENGAALYIKQGTPSSAPTHPELTKNESVYELGLYDIRVQAGSTTVSEADITDTRADENRCGYMREIGAVLLRTLADYAKLTSPVFKGGITVEGKIAGKNDVEIDGNLKIAKNATFSGASEFVQSPTAPTAEKTDRSKKLATTEFVQQVAGGGTRTLVATFTSSGTFNPTTYPSLGNKYDIEMCGGGQGGMAYTYDSSYGFDDNGYGGNAGETIKAFGVYIPSSVDIVIGAGSVKDSGHVSYSRTNGTGGRTEIITKVLYGGDTYIKALGLVARGGGFSHRDQNYIWGVNTGTGSATSGGQTVGVLNKIEYWNDVGSYLVSSQPNATTAGVSLLSPYGNGGRGGAGSAGTVSSASTAGTAGVVKIYAYQ